jgi:hypothetical protein
LGEIDGRRLVAEGFSAAGGEDNDGIAFFEHGAHGGFLEGAQFPVAPDFFDEGQEFVYSSLPGWADGGHEKFSQTRSGQCNADPTEAERNV